MVETVTNHNSTEAQGQKEPVTLPHPVQMKQRRSTQRPMPTRTRGSLQPAPPAQSPHSITALRRRCYEARWSWVLLQLPPLFWGWSQSPGEALSGQMFLPRRWLPWRTVRAVSSRGAASPHTEQPSTVQSGLHSQSPCEGQHSWPCCCPRHEEVKHNVFAI